MYTYQYKRPALTSDIILFRFENQKLQSLFIQRKDDPFAGKWAFPGGFVDEGETAKDAAIRELEEETGLSGIQLAQFYTSSTPNRDPRGWTVSVVFIGFVNTEIFLKPGDDAQDADWFDLDKIPELAFDHDTLLQFAISELKRRLLFSVFGMEVLTLNFSEKMILSIYSQISGSEKTAFNLFNHLIQAGILIKAGSSYHFEQAAYSNVLNTGFFI